jgi:hypothetical protein
VRPDFLLHRLHAPAPLKTGLLALLALLAGALLYMFDRGMRTAYLLPTDLRGLGTTRALFGELGLCLPSFVHAFAFSLLTALLIPRRLAGAACAFWWLVDTCFELGQCRVWSGLLARSLPEWFAHVPVLDRLGRHFTSGTFDPGDLVAVTMGCVVAFTILRRNKSFHSE